MPRRLRACGRGACIASTPAATTSGGVGCGAGMGAPHRRRGADRTHVIRLPNLKVHNVPAVRLELGRRRQHGVRALIPQRLHCRKLGGDGEAAGATPDVRHGALRPGLRRGGGRALRQSIRGAQRLVRGASASAAPRPPRRCMAGRNLNQTPASHPSRTSSGRSPSSPGAPRRPHAARRRSPPAQPGARAAVLCDRIGRVALPGGQGAQGARHRHRIGTALGPPPRRSLPCCSASAASQ